MKVKELIEQLKQYGEDEEVVIARPTFDYWNNVIVKDVKGVYDDWLFYSDNHDAYQIDGHPDDSEEESKAFVIIEMED